MISSVNGNSGATQYISATSARASRAQADAGTSAGAPRNTDFYSRAATKSAATYSRPTAPKSPAVQSPSVATWEDRQTTAKDYNAILEELRAQYDEPEAMRIFDQVLAADGFERVPEYRYGSNSTFNDGYSVYHIPTDRVNGFSQVPLALNDRSQAEHLASLNAANEGKYNWRNDANLILQSTLTGTSIGGEPQTAAESWALFSATRPMSEELQTYWHDRYFADASAETDIDLDAYMAKLQDPAQKSVVAVDAGVGALVSNILKGNGIELGKGEYLDLGWSDELDSITVNSSDTYRDFTELGKAFNTSPELRAAVQRLEQNPPLENVSKLPGEYEDGERSVEYSVDRNITYSADEPSAVVVNDYLGVTGSGYTYVKKAGDYFDPNAENHIVRNQRPVPNQLTADMDEFRRNGAETDALINRTLNDAIATGAPVGGTTSRQAIEGEIDRVSAERDEAYKNVPMYQITSEGATLIEPGAEPEESAYDKEHPLPDRVPEPPKEEIRYEEDRMAGWRKIVEQIRTKFFAIDTLIRPVAPPASSGLLTTLSGSWKHTASA